MLVFYAKLCLKCFGFLKKPRKNKKRRVYSDSCDIIEISNCLPRRVDYALFFFLYSPQNPKIIFSIFDFLFLAAMFLQAIKSAGSENVNGNIVETNLGISVIIAFFRGLAWVIKN